MPQPHVIFHNIRLGCPHNIIHYPQCQYRKNNFYYFYKNIVILFSTQASKGSPRSHPALPATHQNPGRSPFCIWLLPPFLAKKTPVDQIPSVSGSKRQGQACHLSPIFIMEAFFILGSPSAFGVVQKKDTGLMPIASKPVSNYGGEGGI